MLDCRALYASPPLFLEGEIEEEEEEDEDVVVEAVPVETESYVNLRKKMANKHNQKIDNLLAENGKLQRDFRRKQVEGNETSPRWGSPSSQRSMRLE